MTGRGPGGGGPGTGGPGRGADGPGRAGGRPPASRRPPSPGGRRPADPRATTGPNPVLPPGPAAGDRGPRDRATGPGPRLPRDTGANARLPRDTGRNARVPRDRLSGPNARLAGGPSAGRPAARRPRGPRRPPRWLNVHRGDSGRRVGLTLLAIAVVLTLFAGRLVQIQGLESATYKAQANSEKLITTTIPAPRGAIYGSGGLSQPLAMTIEKYQIIADPTQFPAGQLNSVAAKIGTALGLPAASLVSLINHRASRQFVVLANNVTNDHEEKLTALDVPGITSKAVFSRAYPNGSSTANLVGYTNDPSGVILGQAGLEKQYNTLLTGTTGTQQAETGLDGQTIPLAGGEETPAKSGASIRLTIDPVLQFQAQQACQQEVKKTKAENCSVVIMQPKTGDILAMAQWPTFNGVTTQNIPDSAMFEPGSTAKVITAAAALETTGQTPLTSYKIPYQIYRGGQFIRDAEWTAGEDYTIGGIIANSSNVGMSQVVGPVSPQTQYDYLHAFGLGVPLNLGLPNEEPSATYASAALEPPSQWAGDKRYTLSYGQGVSANAVQMASVYATIANDGVRVQPRLVAGTYTPAGQYVAAKPSKQVKVIQPKTARSLISILQQVPGVDDAANQRWGDFPGYAVAAKTGTSTEHVDSCPKSTPLCIHGSSYIGMAPGNNPQVVVAVNVQDPKTKTDYFGDQVAGPVFYSAMNAALQALKIQPQPGLVAPHVQLNAR